MKEFSHRIFKVWAYTVSHSFLILRSPLMFPDQENYDKDKDFNIDIEFIGVEFMEIPSMLEGIVITELVDERIPTKLLGLKTKLGGKGNKFFEIKCQGHTYYLVAANYRIGKSRWISEDRISNPNLEYDEIIGSS